MKALLCTVFLIISPLAGHAQDASYAAGPASCSTPVVYAAPVVYSVPVVYVAPVVYQAPVYYVPAMIIPAASPGCGQSSGAASTVICIGGAQGPYSYSNYGSCGSTVTCIGSRWARPH